MARDPGRGHRLINDGQRSLKVLVVEDESASLELITELLQQLKVEVRALADSRDAAGLIARQGFDAIFLDLAMPVLSGFDLAKLTRESTHNQNAPIVVVTSCSEQDVMHSSFSVGATYFLSKPISRERLVTLLDKIRAPRPENRRRSVRVPLEAKVTCTLESRNLDGLIWNVSQGGIQLEVNGLQRGDAIGISFLLPEPAAVIKAHGVVAWVQDERQGVYFTEMSIEGQEALRAYIRSCS